MRPRVGTDLDAGLGKATDVVEGVDGEWSAGRFIVGERSAMHHRVGAHEVGERNPMLEQERKREAFVVGVAIVERDARRGPAIAARGNAFLGFGEAYEVVAFAEPIDLIGERPSADRPTITNVVGNAMVEENPHRFAVLGRAFDCFTTPRTQRCEVIGAQCNFFPRKHGVDDQ